MVSKISKVLLISLLIGLTFTQAVANCESGQEEQVDDNAGTGKVDSCKKCKDGFSLTKHATETKAKICTACGTECATCEDNVAVAGYKIYRDDAFSQVLQALLFQIPALKH